jgi:hypothetical protein
MSEDRDPSLADKEELLEIFRKMLGEGKKRTLQEMTEDKRKLVENILNLRIVKNDYTLSKAERLRAEDFSFECYEKFLFLCDGDSDLVKRLLGERKPIKEYKP